MNETSIFVSIVKFLLYLFIVYLVPGLVLTDLTDKWLNKDNRFLKKIFLALTIGLVCFTTSFYLFNLFNLRWLLFAYIVFFLSIFLNQKLFNLLKVNIVKSLNLYYLIIVTLILLGVIFQLIPTFKSGLTYSYGLGFWGPNTHDGIWHISLINQLIKGLPPNNPIFAGEILKNYHYFYDLMVAATSFLTNIPLLDLVFRFYPTFFSLLLGIGTYYFASSLFKNKLAIMISLYLVYFAGSFGWIVDLIKNRSLGGESAFWANQSISFNLNPPFAISLCIVIAIFLLLSNKIERITQIFLLILLSGTLISFKAYGSILVLSSLLLTGIIKRSLQYLFIFLVSVFLSVFLFLTNFSLGKQLIIFSPFWFIHSMIDSPDRVGWMKLSLARITGLESKNWFKFISTEIISLSVFLIGNLGLRFFSIFSLLKIKQILKDTYLLFVFIFCLLSFLIPILFIQAGNPWNTIQFFYYGLYTTAIASAITLAYLIRRLPKVISTLLLVSVIILAPVNSITTASYYTGKSPHAILGNDELEALFFLLKQEDGTVLTYPYDKNLQQKIAEPWPLHAYTSSAYISAFSAKTVYLEDEGQNQILLTDYKKRLVESKDFFLTPEAKFLKENKIKYIYLPKIFNTRINKDLLPIKAIFENNTVTIYEVK